MTTENALMNLCDRHYTLTRRVVTSIALPPGSIYGLRREMREHSPALVTDPDWSISLRSRAGELVSLEELEGITEPTVLSDRDWRPSR